MSAAPIAMPKLASHPANKPTLVVPRIWATAEAIAGGARKGPHALHLIPPQAPLQAQRQVPPQPETQTRPEPPENTHRRTVRAFPKPNAACYRKYTETMLQRYMTMSFEAGRVPSLMGRELFKANVSHCKVEGFDDVVIFVHDVAACIETLSPGQQHLVRRIALQGYTQSEAAAMLGICLRTVIHRYAEALDQLTGVLLERKLLQPFLIAEAPQNPRSVLEFQPLESESKFAVPR